MNVIKLFIEFLLFKLYMFLLEVVIYVSCVLRTFNTVYHQYYSKILTLSYRLVAATGESTTTSASNHSEIVWSLSCLGLAEYLGWGGIGI